jgi:hypothetical protein
MTNDPARHRFRIDREIRPRRPLKLQPEMSPAIKRIMAGMRTGWPS